MPKIGTRTRSILLAGGATAILAAPFAGAAGEGRPVDGGARNPEADQSQNYTRETEIIANVGTYGTRQSNKSDNGGGAVYGCRSKAGGTPARNEPCLRATNLNDGLAFEFNSSSGASAGTITVGNGGDSKKPFTTNATGTADGLNADRVDGKNADDFVAKSDANQFAQAGDLLFAKVDAAGSVTGSRGGNVTATQSGTDGFTVTFPKDVSNCSYTATENSATADATPITYAVASAGGGNVTVDQSGGPRTAFHLQVIC